MRIREQLGLQTGDRVEFRSEHAEVRQGDRERHRRPERIATQGKSSLAWDNGEREASACLDALTEAHERGRVVISGVVHAELQAHPGSSAKPAPANVPMLGGDDEPPVDPRAACWPIS